MADPREELTEKQEAFAQAFVILGNAAEAYRQSHDVEPNARDSWLYVEAAQLRDMAKVAARIEELRERAKERSDYSVLDAVDELEKARELAHEVGQPGAAVSAVKAKAGILGLDRPRRVELSGPNGKPIQTEEMSARDIIHGRLARLASGGGAGEDSGGPDGPAD